MSPTPGDPARRRFFTRGSDRFDVRLQLGARYTEQTTRGLVLDATTFPVGFVEIKDTSTSTNAAFRGTSIFTLNRGAITLNAHRHRRGAEGTVERRTLGMSANDWFVPDWQWNAGITYTENKSDTRQTGFGQRDTRGTYLTLGLRYRINDYLDATAQLRRSDYRDNVVDTETERNAVVLTITSR